MVCCRRSVLLAAWVLPALLVLLGAGLVSAGSAAARPLLQQCEDGIDNDADGKIDAPFDPGCTTNNLNNPNAAGNDDTEADPATPPACSNGVAPDFPAAYQCAFAGDPNEVLGAVTPCSDGVDTVPPNGLIDYPLDPNCLWAADPFETTRACSNGIDDDRPLDGFIDFPADIGCADRNDNNESNPPQCNDGRDNDGDGRFDFNPVATRDADCASQRDNLEGPGVAPPECADGADNDGDGVADFPNDPGCSFAGDDDETDPTSGSGSPPPPSPPQCADTLDNDGDGRIDLADPGCSSASDNDETNTITFITQGPAAPPQSARLLTPFPIVRMRGAADKRGVRISLLSVQAPAASTVSIYCTGPGCPRKRVVITAGRAVVRARRFEKRLRSGTILKIYVTKPGYIGKYTRFRLLKNRLPQRVDRCVTKPGTKPRPCPSS
jgi:hypothetical protein